jgi:glycosyltransferase involved in cell wall biosynthesis
VRARQNLYVASTGISVSLFGEFKRRAAWADIVHYHFPWPMMDLLRLLAAPGKPSLVTYHSDIVRQKILVHIYQPIMDRFLGSMNAIVATSPNYVTTSAVLKRHIKKVLTIPIGISEQPIVDADRVASLRQRVGEGFFLFVGALRYYKGLPLLIEAARATGLPTVIAGRGEGEGLIRAVNLPNVSYLGPVDDADKWALLSLCRAFVFPSHLRSEAFGVALLEAARAGRAMISAEIGTGTSYVNASGTTGVLVEPNSVSALSAGMQRLANEPDKTEEMGRHARQRYENLFRADQMSAKYVKLYHRLLAKRIQDRPG